MAFELDPRNGRMRGRRGARVKTRREQEFGRMEREETAYQSIFRETEKSATIEEEGSRRIEGKNHKS